MASARGAAAGEGPARRVLGRAGAWGEGAGGRPRRGASHLPPTCRAFRPRGLSRRRGAGAASQVRDSSTSPSRLTSPHRRSPARCRLRPVRPPGPLVTDRPGYAGRYRRLKPSLLPPPFPCGCEGRGKAALSGSGAVGPVTVEPEGRTACCLKKKATMWEAPCCLQNIALFNACCVPLSRCKLSCLLSVDGGKQ